MKLILPIFLCLLPMVTIPQLKDSLKMDTMIIQPYQPEILTSGFIDIINNGQVNASARFIRLAIGEPGKFSIPLSIYSGVSSNNFQNQLVPGGQPSNEHLVSSFINPLSGLVNISLDGIVFFKPLRDAGMTRAGLLYHGGTRILTGYKTGPFTDPGTGRPVNFLNSFASAGIYLQTGAWEKNNAENLGVFWLAGRYILSHTGEKQFRQILPGIITNGFYHGWSAAWGVEINNLVNLKIIFYKYVKAPELDYSHPIYQFSFNYSLR